MPDFPVESHPLGFFLPPNARLLMLGSFPPDRKRWSINFYYPNFINDMWRIMGLVFHGQKEYFILKDKKAFDEPKIRHFCQEQGIALGDTATKILRLKANASDKFLQVVTPWDPAEILPAIPACQAIAVTGQKAMDTLLSTLPATAPKVGCSSSFLYKNRLFKLFRMPSSSRAYPLSLEKKAALYADMFRDLGFHTLT